MSSKTVNIKLNNLTDNIDDIKSKCQFLESETKKINKVSELIKKLKHNFILKSDIQYNTIDSIWLDYISTKYKIKYCRDSNIIDIAKNDITNSCLLENVFSTYINSPDEDLIMIYKKGEPEIIYYIKSFQIINQNKISLPFHRITIPIQSIQQVFEEKLYDGEILVSCI